MLLEMPEVEELHPVPDAHVPVMKFKFSGVSIDLLYANVSLWVIPEVWTLSLYFINLLMPVVFHVSRLDSLGIVRPFTSMTNGLLEFFPIFQLLIFNTSPERAHEGYNQCKLQ